VYEFNLDSHVLFTHFVQAYDLVNGIYLYESLNEFGISKKLVNLIKITLQDSNGKMKTEEQLTEALTQKEA
jgi:hypothetical protein